LLPTLVAVLTVAGCSSGAPEADVPYDRMRKALPVAVEIGPDWEQEGADESGTPPSQTTSSYCHRAVAALGRSRGYVLRAFRRPAPDERVKVHVLETGDPDVARDVVTDYEDLGRTCGSYRSGVLDVKVNPMEVPPALGESRAGFVQRAREDGVGEVRFGTALVRSGSLLVETTSYAATPERAQELAVKAAALAAAQLGLP